MSRTCEPGDVYVVWDMYDRVWHAWLLLRPCVDADPEGVDTWGYHAKNEHGQYWHYYNLGEGHVSITIDNVVRDWDRL